MPDNRLVIYTAIFGGQEGLLPQYKISGADFICFTDTGLRASPWDVRRMTPKFSDPNRCAKEFKVLPHRFLPEYDTSIWIDGNYLVRGDVHDLVVNYLRENDMAIFDHNQTGDGRNCLYREFESIMQLGRETGVYKDDPEIMRAQIERYRREGYPAGNGLIFASILVRRHNSAEVKNAMELWWKEISTGSRRDQLSFNYAAWKSDFRFAVIDGNVRDNKWFHQIGVHRKSYRMKLLRYRLRRFFGLLRQ